MRVEAVELRQLEIPMVEPMVAAHGAVNVRKTVYVRVLTDVAEGWGECVALNDPCYTSEWSDGELLVLKEIFAPRLIGLELTKREVGEGAIGELFRHFSGHHAAKSAIEMAALDAELRAESLSLAEFWNIDTTRPVECVVAVGMFESIDALLESVGRNLVAGYRHLRLKIEPQRDVECIDAVRNAFPTVRLSVDANGSYNWTNPMHRNALQAIDDCGLVAIEQPVAPHDLRSLIALRDAMATPIVLDESISSWMAAMSVIEMDLCDIVGIKPGLIGGYVAAKRLCDECERRGIPVAIGAYLETGLARAANVALAGLPGARKFPAVLSPHERWFREQLTGSPLFMNDGCISVSTSPGVGADVDISAVDRLTVRTHLVR